MINFKDFLEDYFLYEAESAGQKAYDAVPIEENPLKTDLEDLFHIQANKTKLIWAISTTTPKHLQFKYPEEEKYATELKIKLQDIAKNNKFNFEETINNKGRRLYILTRGNKKYTFMSSNARAGSAGQNKGNNFELELTKDLEEYISGNRLVKSHQFIEQLEEVLKKKLSNNPLISVSNEGGKNQKRPLTFSGRSITIGKPDVDIGSIVTDITILEKNKPLAYLSLKKMNNASSGIVMANIGITKFITKEDIQRGKISNIHGKALLDLFCIDERYFCESFDARANNRDRKFDIPREIIITSQLQHNKEFLKFLESGIGYGYIWVTKIGEHIHLTDMRDKNNLKKFLKIKEAKIFYPNPQNKTITLKVTLEGLLLNIVIRNNDSGVYPNVFNINYVPLFH